MNIREIQISDNSFVRKLVLDVLSEFGAIGPGYASSDAELEAMFQAYQGEGKAYYIVEIGGQRVGAGGFAPLQGEESHICELRKMYLMSSCRELGVGKKLIQLCLEQAKQAGYSQMYLETLDNMQAAQKLYQSVGFRYLKNRKGATGHGSCPVFMMTEL